jgi:hypothetical protein
MVDATQDWPTELLEILFDFIIGDETLKKSGLLTSCLCVSSRWRDIGTRITWTDIALDPASLPKLRAHLLQTIISL